jgi:hypothetical protein
MNYNNYGFIFNDITVFGDTLRKKSKSVWGDKKISNEIEYYLYIQNNKINFTMPRLIDYSCSGNAHAFSEMLISPGVHPAYNELTIEYISNSNTLTTLINKTNVKYYTNKIKTHMNNIHNIKMAIPNTSLINDLYIETVTKILDRYKDFNLDSNSLYNSIISVNNTKIKKIEYYCKTIYTTLLNIVGDRNEYSLIHGDIHLGNILEGETGKLYFIDPRGYFGNSKLFGLEEYDYAKLLFGISGYSIFDNLTVDELSLNDGNLNIAFINDYEYIYETGIFTKAEIVLSLSIWLGNHSCFININKKITSIMIAFYYCEKYLSMD